MESVGTTTKECQQNCDECIFKGIKGSIDRGGTDPHVNQSLHTARSGFKTTLLKNSNGLPVSHNEKVARFEHAEECAVSCRHPAIKQVALFELENVRNVLNAHRCGTFG